MRTLITVVSLMIIASCQHLPKPDPDPIPPVDPVPVDPDFPQGMGGVEWLHTDVSGWPVTADLRVDINSRVITLDYDKASVWPGKNTAGAFVNANPWVFVQHNGRWYAATWEWLRYGQTTKATYAVAGDHIKRSPLHDFRPQRGTEYGFMVSGLARSGVRNVKERSNVVMVRWP